MKTEYLNKCINIFDNWNDDDYINIGKNFLKSPDKLGEMAPLLRDELFENLLNSETNVGKLSILKYYIFPFVEIQDQYLEILKFLLKGKKLITIFTKDFTKEELELRQSLFLFDDIFNYILEGSLISSIDFYKICEELNFSSGIIFIPDDEEKKTKTKALKKEKKSTNAIIDIKNDNIRSILKPGETKLSLREIALLYFYEGKKITRNNGAEISNIYGWDSGGKLYQHYKFYSYRLNRIGSEDTKLKTYKKLDLIEKVIQLITNPESKRIAQEEHDILFEKESKYN